MNRKKGKPPGQWRVRIRFHQYVTKWFDLLHNSRNEMHEILSGTDWRIREFFESESGNPYVAVIEKVKKSSAES